VDPSDYLNLTMEYSPVEKSAAFIGALEGYTSNLLNKNLELDIIDPSKASGIVERTNKIIQQLKEAVQTKDILQKIIMQEFFVITTAKQIKI
jgi:hypothetical protein